MQGFTWVCKIFWKALHEMYDVRRFAGIVCRAVQSAQPVLPRFGQSMRSYTTISSEVPHLGCRMDHLEAADQQSSVASLRKTSFARTTLKRMAV